MPIRYQKISRTCLRASCTKDYCFRQEIQDEFLTNNVDTGSKHKQAWQARVYSECCCDAIDIAGMVSSTRIPRGESCAGNSMCKWARLISRYYYWYPQSGDVQFAGVEKHRLVC